MINKYVKYLDFISPRVHLKINSRDRLQNVFGGWVSMISIISILAITLYFVVETFSRNKFSTIFTQEFSQDSSFNLSQYPVVVSLVDNQAKYFNKPETLYVIRALFYESIFEEDRSGSIIRISEIPVKRCSRGYFGRYWDYYKKYPIDQMWCVETTGINIHGIYGDVKSWGMLGIAINKCVNNTQGENNCQPDSVMDSTLSFVATNILMMDYYINHKNYLEPGVLYLNSIINQISTTIYKQFFLSITNIFYNTDSGFIFQEEIQQEYFSLKMSGESVDNRISGFLTEGCFANISLMMSNGKFIYFRQYSKIQELLANIGGVIKGILCAAIFIQNALIKRFYLVHLCNEVFEIDESNKKDDTTPKNIRSISGLIGLKSFTDLDLIQRIGEKKLDELPGQKNIVLHKHKNDIVKKKRRLNLTCFEAILPLFKLTTSKNLEIIELAEQFFNRNLSIDSVIRRNNKIKIMKDLLFSRDEQNLMKLIQKPLISSIRSDKTKEKTEDELQQQTAITIENLYKEDNKTLVQQRLIEYVLKYIH